MKQYCVDYIECMHECMHITSNVTHFASGINFFHHIFAFSTLISFIALLIISGIIVSHKDLNLKSPRTNQHRWVLWFGDYRVSEVNTYYSFHCVSYVSALLYYFRWRMYRFIHLKITFHSFMKHISKQTFEIGEKEFWKLLK